MVTEERACLLFHGFSGGPFEVEPLALHLQQRGWKCRLPTLPGHETDWCNTDRKTLTRIRYTDWIQAANHEADKMTRRFGRFDLIGFSMGGLLSVYLANRYPVRRVVLLNASVIYFSPYRFILEIVEQIRGKNWSRIHKILHTPWPLAKQFMMLVHKLKPEIEQLKVPALIIQGEKDQVVHPNSAYYIYNHCPSRDKQIQFFPHSKHRICLDQEADQVFQTVYHFLQ